MEFIKNNWGKILFGTVVAGVAGVAVYVLGKDSAEEVINTITETAEDIIE